MNIRKNMQKINHLKKRLQVLFKIIRKYKNIEKMQYNL